MFRRTKSEPATAPAEPASDGGKGRPTPTRKEAQAAARARAKPPRTRREQAQFQRKKRAEASRKVRQAMKTGDEKHLLQRDKGPVRRFVRDYVDSRFSFIELTLPIMVLIIVLGYSGNTSMQSTSNLLLMGMILLLAVDLTMLRFRLRRELGKRFPGDPQKGTTWYALSRSMQMKFMRLPKPQVRIGERLPESYR